MIMDKSKYGSIDIIGVKKLNLAMSSKELLAKLQRKVWLENLKPSFSAKFRKLLFPKNFNFLGTPSMDSSKKFRIRLGKEHWSTTFPLPRNLAKVIRARKKKG